MTTNICVYVEIPAAVGASLLEAVGLGDLVYPNMSQYEDAMVRCALNTAWFDSVRERLRSSIDTSPLFDTERWVQNLEESFLKMTTLDFDGDEFPDIFVKDSDTS